jgi:RNA polymerase sigma factor (sigma-70 family)
VAQGSRNGSQTASAPSDEALMRALASGSDDALRELYARYAPLVFGIATRSLERAAAEEVVQDVFLSLWRGAERFDPERGTLRAWLLQIAHHRILNELRGRRRRVQLEPEPDAANEAALEDPDPGPQGVLWLQFRRAAVRNALAELPPAQRQALALAFLEDLTHEQVAETLQLRLGTAKTRIRAGLAKLRAQLTPILAALALILSGVVAALVARQHDQHQLLSRAVDLTTSSDVTPLRLEATAGPSDLHATYRARTGNDLAVLTLAHFPAAPEGRTYQAWVRHGATWTSLGTAQVDASGHARLIAEGPAFAAAPDELEVTLEPAASSPLPTGTPIAKWPVPPH